MASADRQDGKIAMFLTFSSSLHPHILKSDQLTKSCQLYLLNRFQMCWLLSIVIMTTLVQNFIVSHLYHCKTYQIGLPALTLTSGIGLYSDYKWQKFYLDFINFFKKGNISMDHIIKRKWTRSRWLDLWICPIYSGIHLYFHLLLVLPSVLILFSDVCPKWWRGYWSFPW